MHDNRSWLIGLSRRGWAWEFLRRDPAYQIAHEDRDGDPLRIATWGLLHPADPSRSAIEADVFWRVDDCPEVLPMAFTREPNLPAGYTLKLDGLSCHVAHAADDGVGRRDILFREQGRTLQLAVFGDGGLSEAQLVVPALNDPHAVMARTASLRRLNDLLYNKTMRSALYPPEGRAARLIKVLAALDGWLTGAPQREIATQMFGAARVEREWNDPGENLKDQVRRAISYGQGLMLGEYRQFLRLTFARRIAARRAASYP